MAQTLAQKFPLRTGGKGFFVLVEMVGMKRF